MARDRQRAKQRKARRAHGHGGPTPPAPTQPQRADVPGELEHASGEVDEFDAALVAGANEAGSAPVDGAAEREADVFDDELDLEEDAELEREAVAAGAPAGDRAPARPTAPGTPTRRGPGRFLAFLRASWAELQRVQWPDRRQVAQATAVVLGFVVVAGLYLGLADAVAKEVVNVII